MKRNQEEPIIYTGQSMHPMFKDGDEMYVRPYNGARIYRGDVVVFSWPNNSRKVVHRVVRVGQNSIITRGDNNRDIDTQSSEFSRVLGRVEYAKRNGSIYRVRGGLFGMAYVFPWRIVRWLDRWASFFLHYPYRFLANTRMLSRMPYIRSKIKVVSFKRGSSEELQLLFGARVVGRKLSTMSQWWIKRPFRLLVDEDFF